MIFHLDLTSRTHALSGPWVFAIHLRFQIHNTGHLIDHSHPPQTTEMAPEEDSNFLFTLAILSTSDAITPNYHKSAAKLGIAHARTVSVPLLNRICFIPVQRPGDSAAIRWNFCAV